MKKIENQESFYKITVIGLGEVGIEVVRNLSKKQLLGIKPEEVKLKNKSFVLNDADNSVDNTDMLIYRISNAVKERQGEILLISQIKDLFFVIFDIDEMIKKKSIILY